jgi:hypothetical protein
MATGRIGVTPVLRTRWSDQPTAGTTSLSGLDDNSVALVYDAGYEAVYRNGVLLSRGNDYTATDGTTITLIDATLAGDIIEVFANDLVPLTDAISKGQYNAKGALLSASAASTPGVLAVGTNNQVLTADSAEATGLKWATPSSGSWTLISTTTLSGSSVSLTSIPSTYNNLKLIINDYVPSGNATLQIQVNSDTSTGRSYAWQEGNLTSGGITGDIAYGLTTRTGLNVNNQTSAVDNNNSAIIFFDNYTDTGVKFWRSYHSMVKTSVGNCWNLTAVAIDPTAAISSVQILLSAGTFSQGTAYLYGSK